AALAGNVTRLVVVGVKTALDDAKSRARLEQLVDAQRYTRGLGLIPAGTPTNNTSTARSGYNSDDPGFERSFALERERPPALDPATDGAALARALGVGSATFINAAFADGREGELAGAAATALWPVADGSLRRALLEAGVLAADLRSHFAAFVRGAGPLSTLRIGTQPYGVLPATSLERWATPPGPERALVDATRSLLRTWLRFARGVPVVPPAGDLDTFGLLLTEEGAAASYVLRSLGDNGTTHLGRTRVQAGAEDETNAPQPDYVALLRRATAATLASESYWNGPVPKPAPLLYLLLRAASQRMLAARTPAKDRTAYLAALGRMAPASAGSQRHAVAGMLDAATFRLDAWATSIATRRLQSLRADAGPATLALGGYGVVEGLQLPSGSDRSRGSMGFVQAPSLGHATTGAVLRSGYLEHRNGGGSSPLAIDLSSARVHAARWLLAGVAEGQSLGALLGYRLERSLHAGGLDRYIAPLRTLAAIRDETELGAARTAEQTAFEAWTSATNAANVAEAASNEADAAAAAAMAALQQLENDLSALRVQAQALSVPQNELAAQETKIKSLQRQIAEAKPPRARIISAKIVTEPDQVDLPDDAAVADWRADLGSRRAELRTAMAARDAAAATLDGLAPGGSVAAQAALDAENARLEEKRDPLTKARTSTRTAATKAANALTVARTAASGAETELRNRRAKVTATLRRLWSKARQSIAANNVLDGLELHRRWQAATSSHPPRWDGTTIPFGVPETRFPAPGTADFQALSVRLDALADTVDAVADALVAESVYQVVQGNPVRSGATIDAIASGDAPPPELEVLRTPRSGVSVTHRVVVLLHAAPPAAPPWP
ncbi:MAG: hypothetical protein M3540_07875, partial [Actinomycetota bacterium]|nr:hypothetical protein [Actinomycetota bacterium]